MILITGSNGLLGSALVQHLTTKQARLTGTDLGAATHPHPFEPCDLTDARAAEALVQRLRPRLVIHGAAMTAVDLCETKRAEAWRINVDATATLARASNAIGAT